jgi:hypothetical protein
MPATLLRWHRRVGGPGNRDETGSTYLRTAFMGLTFSGRSPASSTTWPAPLTRTNGSGIDDLIVRLQPSTQPALDRLARAIKIRGH